VRFVLDTRASPEQVRRALTDFSDRRLQTWSRTLDPQTYDVRGQGDTWATARESTPGSPFWVVARYDWAEPDRVTWTIEESSYGGGGTGVVRIEPRDDGGSRLHAEWDYTGARRAQRPLLFLIGHGPMRRIISRLWTRALDRFADTDTG
jgi:hypothetical protein